MLNKRTKVLTILLFTLILSVSSAFSQRNGEITVNEYIETYKDIAIKKMREYGIPASITLAQGILESGTGNSDLARKANNHFGIKCHGWKGKKFHKDDDKKHECFRKYNNAEESFHDHSLFLTQRSRYAFLFEFDVTDYKKWAHGLKQAGYATNPKYPALLIQIIEENHLYYFDRDIEPMIVKQTQPRINSTSPEPAYPAKQNYRFLDFGPNERKIYENNGVKFIYGRKGDSFYSIASDFNIYTWQIAKYNDMDKEEKIIEGQIIYLEKKRGRSEKEYHIVREGETIHYISQLYGVRLNKLMRRNNMEDGMQPYIGQKLALK